MIEHFNKVCEFRRFNPPVKGAGIKTNDPITASVKGSLLSLKSELETMFQDYRGHTFRFQESRGATLFPFVTHVSILPKGQEVSNGIYVVLCFDKNGNGALVGCTESKSNRKGLPTIERKVRGSKLNIDVDGSSQNTKYNNVFVNPREFIYPIKGDLQDVVEHIRASLDLALYYLGELTEEDILGGDDRDGFIPPNKEDVRARTLRQIVARRGQKKFRDSLIKQYKRCVFTEFCVLEALEAAHIVPYNGDETNHVQNGLLLRSDIHTLFDLGLISVNPATMKVVLNTGLQQSEYADLDGKDVSSLIANRECLRDHFDTTFKKD